MEAAVIGFDIIKPDYNHCNNRVFGVVMFMMSYLFVSIYCFKLYSNDLIKFVFCFVTFGFLIKGAVQICSDLSARTILLELLHDVEKMFKFASQLGSEFDDILVKHCGYVTIASKITKFMFYSLGSTTLLYPFVSKLMFDELILPYGFELPFVEPFSVIGYSLNFVYSAMCSVLCAIGFTISDSFILIMILPIYGIYAALINLLENFKHFNDTKNQRIMKRRQKMLSDAIKLHKMLLDYIDGVSGVFEISNFYCINTIVSQCVASLFALIVSRWYIGACFVMANLFQILVYCILGEILLFMQERFLTQLMEITWVDKSKKEKNVLIFMTLRSQKMSKLSCVTGKLNLSTFVSVRIFSIFSGDHEKRITGNLNFFF